MKTILSRWPVAALLGLALGAVRLILPWPMTKFLVGVAVIVAVVAVVVMAYRRYVSSEPATGVVEETTTS